MAAVADRKVSFHEQKLRSGSEVWKDHLLEELKDEMSIALLGALQDAALACAQICVERVAAVEREFATKEPEGGISPHSRRTSFYELFAQSRKSTKGTEGGEGFASEGETITKLVRGETINLMQDDVDNSPAFSPAKSATLEDMFELNLSDSALESNRRVVLDHKVTVESFQVGGDDTLETPPSKEDESVQTPTPAKTDDVAASLAARKAENAAKRMSRMSVGSSTSGKLAKASSRLSAAGFGDDAVVDEPSVKTTAGKLDIKGPWSETKDGTEPKDIDAPNVQPTTLDFPPEGGDNQATMVEASEEQQSVVQPDSPKSNEPPRRPSISSTEKMAPRRSVTMVTERGGLRGSFSVAGSFSAADIVGEQESMEAVDDEFQKVMEKWDSRKRGSTLGSGSGSAVEIVSGTPFDRKPSWEDLAQAETTTGATTDGTKVIDETKESVLVDVSQDTEVPPKVETPLEPTVSAESSEKTPVVVIPYMRNIPSTAQANEATPETDAVKPEAREPPLDGEQSEELPKAKTLAEYGDIVASTSSPDLESALRDLTPAERARLANVMEIAAEKEIKVKSLREYVDIASSVGDAELAEAISSLGLDDQTKLRNALTMGEMESKSLDEVAKSAPTPEEAKDNQDISELDQQTQIAQQAAIVAVAKATEVATASIAKAQATEEHQSREIVAPIVEEIVEASVTDQRSEDRGDMKQQLADALTLSAANGTLQSFLEKKSGGNAIGTKAPQADVVGEAEPVVKVASPYLSHVIASNESADQEKNILDESEPAPRVVAPYLSHAITSKESAEHEKHISDESELAPRVVAPYLSHAITSKESAEEPEKAVSAESELAPREEQEKRISDELEPAPTVVSPYLSHAITSNESAEDLGKSISDEPEPAPRVVIPYLSHTVASKVSEDEPEEAIAAESEPRVATPYLSHAITPNESTKELEKAIPEESEPGPRVVTPYLSHAIAPNQLAEESEKTILQESDSSPKIATPYMDVPPSQPEQEEELKKEDETTLSLEPDTIEYSSEPAPQIAIPYLDVPPVPQTSEPEEIQSTAKLEETESAPHKAEPAQVEGSSSRVLTAAENEMARYEAELAKVEETLDVANVLAVPEALTSNLDVEFTKVIDDKPPSADVTTQAELTKEEETLVAVDTPAVSEAPTSKLDVEPAQTTDEKAPSTVETPQDELTKLEETPAAVDTPAVPEAPTSKLEVEHTQSIDEKPPSAVDTTQAELTNVEETLAAVDTSAVPEAPTSKLEVELTQTIDEKPPSAVDTTQAELTKVEETLAAVDTPAVPEAPTSKLDVETTQTIDEKPPSAVDTTQAELTKVEETLIAVDCTEAPNNKLDVEPTQTIDEKPPSAVDTTQAELTKVEAAVDTPAVSEAPSSKLDVEPTQTLPEKPPNAVYTTQAAVFEVDLLNDPEFSPPVESAPAVSTQRLAPEASVESDTNPSEMKLTPRRTVNFAEQDVLVPIPARGEALSVDSTGSSTPPARVPTATEVIEPTLASSSQAESSPPAPPPAVAETNSSVMAISIAPNSTQLRKIYAPSDVKSLGLTLAGLPPDTVTIKTVTADSWAEQQMLSRGTRIITVNGQLASSMTTDEVKGCLRQRPIEMEVLPPEEEGEQLNIAARASIVIDPSAVPRVSRAGTAP